MSRLQDRQKLQINRTVWNYSWRNINNHNHIELHNLSAGLQVDFHFSSPACFAWIGKFLPLECCPLWYQFFTPHLLLWPAGSASWLSPILCCHLWSWLWTPNPLLYRVVSYFLYLISFFKSNSYIYLDQQDHWLECSALKRFLFWISDNSNPFPHE